VYLLQQKQQTRKINKVMAKQQASVVQMPQNTNFNSTQRLRFSQSNKKGSIERA
jgi:hypothetical protein